MTYSSSERERTGGGGAGLAATRDRGHHRDERTQRTFLSSAKEKDRKRPKSAERHSDQSATFSSQVS